VANFWRAVAHDPEAVAEWADWPVNENDKHARHLWLVGEREWLTRRLNGDPDFYDARIAGWWVWGVCLWIGGGFCSGDGPWRYEGGQMVDTREDALSNAGQGIHRQMPHLGDAGRGIYEWFAMLAERLRGVRVCSGDWTRVMSESVTFRHGLTSVFLDPPYGDEIEQTRVYATDCGQVSDAVREWCLENGNHPLLRIALCGYAGEGHEALEDYGWTQWAWKSAGGYGGGRGGTGDANRAKERIWYSPHCREPAQGVLDFGEVS